MKAVLRQTQVFFMVMMCVSLGYSIGRNDAAGRKELRPMLFGLAIVIASGAVVLARSSGRGLAMPIEEFDISDRNWRVVDTAGWPSGFDTELLTSTVYITVAGRRGIRKLLCCSSDRIEQQRQGEGFTAHLAQLTDGRYFIEYS